MEEKDQILVGETKNTVFISVEGRGNFQNSHSMKDFALAMIDRGKTNIVLDLKSCVGMDSTFMGVLAGLAIKLRKSNQKALTLINVSPHNLDLLETLGLSQLLNIVDVTETPSPSVTPVPSTQPEKGDVAKHMLEAHEQLSEISEANKVKFKNVIQYLQEDLEKNEE